MIAVGSTNPEGFRRLWRRRRENSGSKKLRRKNWANAA
ncbi:hypothetical protein CKA32_005076 [Geitlerinema sp. FC II]|nr:hypothetical protein CKA32_005076 [Geitlerinema sp. FC II]